MADMICTRCGREAVAGKRFCGGCGQALQAAAALPQPSPAPRFCVKCGAPYTPGKRFCKQCGHSVGATVPVASIQSSTAGVGGMIAHEGDVGDVQAENIVKPPLEEAAPSQIFGELAPQAVDKHDLDQPVAHNSEASPNPLSNGRSLPQLTNANCVEQEIPAPTAVLADPPAVHVPRVTESVESKVANGEEIVLRGGRVFTRRGRGSVPLIVGSVCVTAVALGIVLFIAVAHHGNRNSAPVAIHPALSSEAASPPIAGHQLQHPPSKPVAAAVTKAPIASIKPALQRKDHRREASRDSNPIESAPTRSQLASQRVQGDNCNLSQNMLPKMLDQAEKNREQGNYPSAARQYRSVLACDHNNTRARSGLETTLLDIQHQ